MKSAEPGARWLRCDLHVHTPFDKEKKFGEDIRGAITAFKKSEGHRFAQIADRFVQACRNAADGNGMDLVALTDHNSIDGYRYLRPQFETLRLQARDQDLPMPAILPGVEFSVGGERPIHFLVIFASETGPDDIHRAIRHVFGAAEPFDPKTGTPRATRKLAEIQEQSARETERATAARQRREQDETAARDARDQREADEALGARGRFGSARDRGRQIRAGFEKRIVDAEERCADSEEQCAAVQRDRDSAREALIEVTSERDAALADRDRAIKDIAVERDKTKTARDALKEAPVRALQAAGDALYRMMRAINPDMKVQRSLWPLYEALAAGDGQALEQVTQAAEVRSEPAPAPRPPRGRDGGGRER